MTIGEKIIQARQQQGLTQKQLAEKLAITPARLNYWENDKRFPPINMLNKIIDLLDIDANYLLGRKTNGQTESKDINPNGVFSPQELERIKKYRALDSYGQAAVNGLLDIEYKRCREQNKNKA